MGGVISTQTRFVPPCCVQRHPCCDGDCQACGVVVPFTSKPLGELPVYRELQVALVQCPSLVACSRFLPEFVDCVLSSAFVSPWKSGCSVGFRDQLVSCVPFNSTAWCGSHPMSSSVSITAPMGNVARCRFFLPLTVNAWRTRAPHMM